ncbi:recombinase family protein [Antrihabitans sp. YC2-6]|uniref:recombinase family protein n=1 Tax=Antrihabitans sp. YC2-6 TaxID=2799498 RepID=UPI0018F6E10F|nr:recombinase family protein [Antrihabitans sp. YC2-6]MBJ8343973.1 recombinase family protein [Antrihabitans sp. YC2-6]
MSKIVAYARVSTDKQTVENQLFEITNYLAREQRKYDEAVVETISGMKLVADRELGRLMDELDEGDTLIVSETSRISRRLGEIYATIQYFLDRGVIVIAVKQNYRFANDIQSKVIAFAFGIASEIERDLISSRTKEALARLKSEGKRLGRPPGSGNPDKWLLAGKDEEIMNYLDKGVSKAAIARLYEVDRDTVRNYIAAKNLEHTLRTRKLNDALLAERTWHGVQNRRL